MDIVSRLKTFIDYLGVPVTQFADNCGIPRPTLSQLLNGRNKTVRDELIAKIHAAYPRLSVMWLMFGEGEAILDERPQSSVTPTLSAVKHPAPLQQPTAEATLGATQQHVAAAPIRFPIEDTSGIFDEPEVSGSPSGHHSRTDGMDVIQMPIDFYFDMPQHDNGAIMTADQAAAEHQRPDVDSAATDEAIHGKGGQPAPVSPSGQSSGLDTAENQDAKGAEEAAKGSNEKAGDNGGGRRVVSIIVYYSDSSYQAFVPDEDSVTSLPFMSR